MKEITSQQQRVLDCIQNHLKKTGFPPTRADICRELGKMLDEFSKYRNFGRSSVVAVLIFVCVLPVIIGSALRERDNSNS